MVYCWCDLQKSINCLVKIKRELQASELLLFASASRLQPFEAVGSHRRQLSILTSDFGTKHVTVEASFLELSDLVYLYAIDGLVACSSPLLFIAYKGGVIFDHVAL